MKRLPPARTAQRDASYHRYETTSEREAIACREPWCVGVPADKFSEVAAYHFRTRLRFVPADRVLINIVD